MSPHQREVPEAISGPETPTTCEESGINLGRALEELRQEVMGGFIYAHGQAHVNTNRILEATSFLYALIELLKEKGIVRLPNPRFSKPATAPTQPQDGKDLYS